MHSTVDDIVSVWVNDQIEYVMRMNMSERMQCAETQHIDKYLYVIKTYASNHQFDGGKHDHGFWKM